MVHSHSYFFLSLLLQNIIIIHAKLNIITPYVLKVWEKMEWQLHIILRVTFSAEQLYCFNF